MFFNAAHYLINVHVIFRHFLSESDREELKKFSTTGTHSVKLVNRAKIILALDTSQGRKKQTYKTITNHLNTSNIFDKAAIFLEKLQIPSELY